MEKIKPAKLQSKIKPSNYKIKIETSGETYEQEGRSIGGTLAKFPLSWENIKSKSVLTVTKDDSTHTRLMPMFTLRRIFSNKLVRSVWVKNLKYLLKNDADGTRPSH